MPIEVTMPRLSDTMQQGTIIKWHVAEGAPVRTGEVFADIETDKATMEQQSFDDGVLAYRAVQEGATVAVGTLIAVIASAGEDWQAVKSTYAGGSAPAKAPSDSATKPAAAQATAPSPSSLAKESPAPVAAEPKPDGGASRVFASPLARKVADEHGVDLRSLQGSGPGGRIVRADVEAAASSPAPEPRRKGLAPAASVAVPAFEPVAQPGGLEPRTVALSNMRRTIASRLVESKTSIPHYQVTVNVDMDPLLDLRERLNDQLGAQGVKLSVNDFLVRACALAMHEHPFLNSRWVQSGQDASIEVLPRVNIGVAIALPEDRGGGLVVATLRDADRMGLRQISASTRRLADKARTKGLSIEEMADSTFTISNLGMFGVDHFTAIINPPNVAILAVGAAVEKPVVRGGAIVVGREMSMTMSSDHRVVDGAMAARYLAGVKGMLEKPATLLV